METSNSIPPISASADTPKAIRILCVEDNDGDALLLREYLRACGLDPRPLVERVATLAAALELLGNSSADPDIILLDLSLPDSHGRATFDRIYAAAQGKPVTILSGSFDLHLATELVKTGAQDYLLKEELSPGLLARSISYSIERQRIQRELQAANENLRQTTYELQATQMALIQAEKLESLGRLAAGVAHEVKNPLAILQIAVDWLYNRADQIGAETLAIVDEMKTAIWRADTIVREMVDFSRFDRLNLQPCMINTIVDRTVHMVRHEFMTRNITPKIELLNPIPLVLADAAKFEQVLINLLINGMQAMESGGVISVRTRCEQFEKPQPPECGRASQQFHEGDTVVIIEVRDQGHGIADHLLHRVLEPFFTTKPVGQGTGLGLSVVGRIVDLHGGQIQLRNVTDPKGLEVQIILKAHEEAETGDEGEELTGVCEVA